jgi:peptide/nickel transport system ATP-binding protein
LSCSAGHPEPLLELRELVIEYPAREGDGWRPVVDGLSLELGAGERIGVVGESGSGKSVAALACLGLVREPGRITSGAVTVAGVDPTRASARELTELRGGTVGMVFQEPSSALNPVFTVGFQLAEAVRCHSETSPHEARVEALRLLDEAALDEAGALFRAYPHQLSGGQLQRVMVALALAGSPRLLIADEPSTALDSITQARIIELLASLTRERRIALVLISHDPSIMEDLVERVLVMYAGRLVEEGPADELLANPLHPYSRMLLGSIPGRDRERSVAPGRAAAPTPTSGCRYAPRCSLAEPSCRSVEAELLPAGQDRRSRCPITLPDPAGGSDD